MHGSSIKRYSCGGCQFKRSIRSIKRLLKTHAVQDEHLARSVMRHVEGEIVTSSGVRLSIDPQHACCAGFWSLLLCRMAVGIGEASFVALAAPFIGEPFATTSISLILRRMSLASRYASGSCGIVFSFKIAVSGYHRQLWCAKSMCYSKRMDSRLQTLTTKASHGTGILQSERGAGPFPHPATVRLWSVVQAVQRLRGQQSSCRVETHITHTQ